MAVWFSGEAHRLVGKLSATIFSKRMFVSTEEFMLCAWTPLECRSDSSWGVPGSIWRKLILHGVVR